MKSQRGGSRPSPWHLFKRLVGALTAQPLTTTEKDEIHSVLSPNEGRLFERFGVPDQRHALVVLRRFDARIDNAPIFARRAALMHDIGKIESNLGTTMRVLATVLGGRTQRFRTYLDHDQGTLRLLREADSDARTTDLLSGVGDEMLLAALQDADDI